MTRPERFNSFLCDFDDYPAALKRDVETAERLAAYLGTTPRDEYMFLDYCFFEAGAVPKKIAEKYMLYVDSILIIAINEDGVLLTQWVPFDDFVSYPTIDLDEAQKEV